MNTLKLAAVTLLLMFELGTSHALDMRIASDTITLSGPIRDADDDAFKTIMASAAGQGVKIVRLNSTGGKIDPAANIARLIRRRGLTTLADGAGVCSSACTVIFAGGSARHYVNGERVRDGQVKSGAQKGLAYHQGNAPLSRDAGNYSPRATGLMMSLYSELGVSGARQFPDKAGPREYWQISGQTALSNGIATSLLRP